LCGSGIDELGFFKDPTPVSSRNYKPLKYDQLVMILAAFFIDYCPALQWKRSLDIVVLAVKIIICSLGYWSS